jgi:hypothetical protein
MGTIGYTYGSEWHLLRYLGYHRHELNRRIEETIPGCKLIDWQDFHFREQAVPVLLPPVILEPRVLDAERTGIDFLPPELRQHVSPEWRPFFPEGNTGGQDPQNWDAVAEAEVDGEPYWLIVEAKGHLGELRSRCQAGRDSLALIQKAFEQVKAGWNDQPIVTWLDRYYQFCNRVAFLHFLTRNSIRAKLLFIYFLDDRHPPKRKAKCPTTELAWASNIQQMEEHVGWLNKCNPLAENVHKLFLPVCPTT